MHSAGNNKIKQKIVVVGGGAAGFFGAINSAISSPNSDVILLEGTRRVLTKVKISGGGRCNATHSCFDPNDLIKNYPRGARELLGPFNRFGPTQIIEWFSQRGVEMKTEGDGRMFPESNSSQTIIDCLRSEAEKSGVELRLGKLVQAIKQDGDGFQIQCRGESDLSCDKILIATGSAPFGYEVAALLGHKVLDPVPSLFTFNIKDSRIKELPGVSFDHAHLQLNLPGEKQKSRNKLEFAGPLLITHWGLSGPGVLKLSAWGARKLYDHEYQANLTVNFCPEFKKPQVLEKLQALRKSHSKQRVLGTNLFSLPKRFWAQLVQYCEIESDETWANQTNLALDKLAQEISCGEYKVTGKGVFKEEFVTCGGVKLKEVDFRTMESKICPNLFFAGEVLDIDGITGGFNFQNAWTTSWVAAQGMTIPTV